MPKLSTFRDFPYTAKVFNYTETTDSTGVNTRTYTYLKDIKLDLNTGVFGKATIFFGDDAYNLLPASRLEQVKDKNGNEIYPGGVWTLNGIVPSITMFGTREGFQAEGKLTHETG